MKSRVVIIDNCFTHLELITLARMELVRGNPDVMFFDDLATPRAMNEGVLANKGPKGPRNRWGQMK